MRLIVLGSAAYGPFGGSPCPGYLIQTRSATLLLDCGPGVAAALGTLAHPSQLSAIAISRLDPEYWLDLLPLSWAACSRPVGGAFSRPKPLPVYLPPGGMERVEEVARRLLPGSPRELLPLGSEVVGLGEYKRGAEIPIRGLSIKCFEPPWHPSRGFSLRVEAEGVTITFAADLRPSEALIEAARGAEVLICSASPGVLTCDNGPSELASPFGAARQAGSVATAAGVGSLMLSGLLSLEEDHISRLVEAARERFDGSVYVAEPELRLNVYPRSPSLAKVG